MSPSVLPWYTPLQTSPTFDGGGSKIKGKLNGKEQGYLPTPYAQGQVSLASLLWGLTTLDHQGLEAIASEGRL